MEIEPSVDRVISHFTGQAELIAPNRVINLGTDLKHFLVTLVWSHNFLQQLPVSKGIMEENTMETMASVRNMVEAADYAIESGQVEQVLLKQHAPRFDTPRDDPYGARPHLARLANETLERVAGQSRNKEKITHPESVET